MKANTASNRFHRQTMAPSAHLSQQLKWIIIIITFIIIVVIISITIVVAVVVVSLARSTFTHGADDDARAC